MRFARLMRPFAVLGRSSHSVVLALMLSLGTAAGAVEPAAVESGLPRDYSGEFAWANDPTPQKIDIAINAIRQRDDHDLEAIGCGRYIVLGRVTSIGVRMRIEVPSLEIEIFEFDPLGSGADTFTTDGSHKGRLSADLKSIDAQWTTLATGQRGSLHLEASDGRISCDGSVAALPALMHRGRQT